eukprot:1161564-Pelagomonas_calceolata.AAC.13
MKEVWRCAQAGAQDCCKGSEVCVRMSSRTVARLDVCFASNSHLLTGNTAFTAVARDSFTS